jgi:glycine cleavage system H protein
MAEVLEVTIDKFRFTVPTDRAYSRDGVWVLPVPGVGAPRVRVGLSDYVQRHSGDLAFATVTRVGTRLGAGEELAEVETVKVNLGVPCPFAGTVVEINPALELSPEVINRDPYGDGWLAVLEPADFEAGGAALLDGPAYLALVEALARQELAS